jgi:hypothetical protein
MSELITESCLRVSCVYNTVDGYLDIRTGYSLEVPAVFDTNPLARPEPIKIGGLLQNDLAVFLSMRRKSYQCYVTDVDEQNIGTIVNSDFVHASPETHITPYLRQVILGLEPGQLEEFGEEHVWPVLAYLGIQEA